MSEYNENSRTPFDDSPSESSEHLTFGQKVADVVAKFGGSCQNIFNLAVVGGLLTLFHQQVYMTDRQTLFDLYWVENLSTKEIAPIFNVNPQTISNWMKKMDIDIRTSAESTRGIFNKKTEKPIYKNRKYIIDETVFSSITHDSAWVLGLIVSDGCLNQECNKWFLCQKDDEILEKTRIIIKTDRPITRRANNGFANGNLIYNLCVQNTKQTHDLVNLGLTPKKSKTAEFPVVSDDFKLDVIRGILDGDGWIGCDSKKRYSVGWCGSERVINYIFDFFGQHFNMKATPKKMGNIWCLRITNKKHIKNILNLIYMNSHDGNRMSRKYKLYLDFLEMSHD